MLINKQNKDTIFIEKVEEFVLLAKNEKQHDVIEKLLKLLQDYFKTSWCVIRKLNEIQTNLEIIGHTGLKDQEYLSLKMLSTNDTVFESVVVQKKSIIVNKLETEKRIFNQYYLDFGIKSFLVSPIVNDGRTIGSIKIYSKKVHTYTANDLFTLEWIASKISKVLCNADESHQKKVIDYTAIKTLIALLEVKDKYTKGHSRNVSNYSALIAKTLKLSESEFENIRIAALLHDVGKIIIVNEILNKSGKLNDLEFSIIKEHPTTGADSLRAGGFNEDICNIVEQHHERWDGSGYPMGISSNDICIGARIVSVADAYDAMTSDRQYGKIKTYNEALVELKRCSGKQFCPSIVAAFASIDKKILNILD